MGCRRAGRGPIHAQAFECSLGLPRIPSWDGLQWRNPSGSSVENRWSLEQRRAGKCSCCSDLGVNTLGGEDRRNCPGALLPGRWACIWARDCRPCDTCFCNLGAILILFLEAWTSTLLSGMGPGGLGRVPLPFSFCLTKAQSQR